MTDGKGGAPTGGSGPGRPPMPSPWFIVVMIGAVLLQLWFNAADVRTIPYSEFREALEEGRISEVSVSRTYIEGRLQGTPEGAMRFRTVRVDPGIARTLEEAGVTFGGRVESGWLAALLGWLLPFSLMIGLWYFVIRRMSGGGGAGGLMGVGKAKARVYVERDTGVRFADVAGVDEAKAELAEVVHFLEDRTTYARLGAHVPRGILLVGPPGTGKTLLARAVAGEARVPFFSITGSEFVEMFVGVGAARVRDLFEQARRAAPCILFIDELDALGRARSAFGGLGGHDEKEQTLNQLLAELDGFDPRAGIVLLAATNRPEVLDPALLRAGRFDRQVVVDRPDRPGREAILDVHLRAVRTGEDALASTIAGITAGFTGADLANLVNEAAILATRRGADAVELADFTAAVERIVAGTERRGRLLDTAERRRVAYHEMGHALVAASLPGTDPVHKVSIIPRSVGALGYTLQRPTEDRFLITTAELENRMTVLLAGRAAEALVFGEISTGAADDLIKVTDIARQIVARFGMSEALGQAVLEPERQRWLGDGPEALAPARRDHAEATAREVDLAVRELIDRAYARAREILERRRALLDEGAALLLERETLTPEEFPALASKGDDEDTGSARGARTGEPAARTRSPPVDRGYRERPPGAEGLSGDGGMPCDSDPSVRGRDRSREEASEVRRPPHGGR